jgi:hypothetical protein
VIIGVQNFSSLVTSLDTYDMVLLVNRQVRDHVAPAWGLLPPEVVYLSAASGMHCDAVIGLFDDAAQAGDLGWHTEGAGASVYGRVFARPVLDNGGNALSAELSVCSVLSHEAVETLGDPTCARWAQRADGTLVAYELADPVESDSYKMTVTASSGEQVAGTVSDFVLPSWFDPDAAPGATDYMGLVTAPFQLRSTGYAVEMTGGTISEAWGEHYPEWRKETKVAPSARTARRDPVLIRPTSLA